MHELTKQIKKAKEAEFILRSYGLVYLAMAMRTQKTPTAIILCKNMQYDKVLFITEKKAIKGINYWLNYLLFDADVINYDSVHKIDKTINYDVIVLDEAHNLGTIKPRNTNKKNKFIRLKLVEDVCKNKPIIFLSGTPAPESPTQLFSQFNISCKSPFAEKTFVAFAEKYVNIRKDLINGYYINNYKNAKTDEIYNIVNKYFVTMSLSEAGAKQYEYIENKIYVEIPEKVKTIISLLLKDKAIKINNRYVVCETAAAEKGKVLQICSGTVLDENQQPIFIHNVKIDKMKELYKNERIAVFYNYKAERELLLNSFIGEITENNDEFQNSEKRIYISQITSGSSGVDLSNADRLIYYNICHSGKHYVQSKARHSSLTREKPLFIDYLFTNTGVEDDVLRSVRKKENYTTEMFCKFKLKLLSL